jgi:methylated-DNA-[protein]-cysteine S-methyltransferase
MDSPLTLEQVASPIGILTLVTEGDVVHALSFPEGAAQALDLFRRRCPGLHFEEPVQETPSSVRLRAYFQGELEAISGMKVQADGTAFQQEVWAALREIAPGTTTTYGELARRLGRPGASRAVGLANSENPIAIVVPCHRVVGAGGALTGYGGGLERKRWLLGHEAAASFQLR